MKIIHYVAVVFAILLFIFIITRNGFGADQSYQLCVAECQADVMDLNQCMKDEQEHWSGDIPDKELRRSCKQLILNEKIDCKINCAVKEISIEDVKLKRATTFWDKHVRNFPESNE